jgi:large subunit ribosomal protein L3
MGNERVTEKGLSVVGVDTEKNILTIKGLVPGSIGGLLIIEKA